LFDITHQAVILSEIIRVRLESHKKGAKIKAYPPITDRLQNLTTFIETVCFYDRLNTMWYSAFLCRLFFLQLVYFAGKMSVQCVGYNN
jgi:hypothetical protein